MVLAVLDHTVEVVAAQPIDPVRDVALHDRPHPIGRGPREHAPIVGHTHRLTAGTDVAEELGTCRGRQRLDREGIQRDTALLRVRTQGVAEGGCHAEVEDGGHARKPTSGL